MSNTIPNTLSISAYKGSNAASTCDSTCNSQPECKNAETFQKCEANPMDEILKLRAAAGGNSAYGSNAAADSSVERLSPVGGPFGPDCCI